MNDTMTISEWIEASLGRRLEAQAVQWLTGALEEVRTGVDPARFCALLSVASRHVRPRPLEPDAAERDAVAAAHPGCEVERWDRLEAARVALVLARSDLAEDSAFAALEEAFRFADEGELRGLYRALALLPRAERFVWRVGEGCRSNMRSVFEAAALDTPYLRDHFDEVAFNQAAIKCVFVEAPLWRMVGLDERLNAELARMALDLVDERRSAHRPVQHDLWLCLGPHGGERATTALERELGSSNTPGRRAAGYALARAGEHERLRRHLEGESDPAVIASFEDALAGNTTQGAFRALDPGPS